VREKFLLITISTCVGFLLVELLLGIFWQNPYKGSQPDKLLRLMVPHANLDLVFRRDEINSIEPVVRFRTNERNYLQPVDVIDDPKFTVGFLGGSTTECKAVQETKRFPYVVSKLLNEEGLHVQSLNAAHSGNTMQESINTLFNHLILEKPGIVVLMHAVNDGGLLRRSGSYRPRMNQDVSLGMIGRLTIQMASTHSAVLGVIRSLVTAPKFTGRTDRNYSHVQIDQQPFRSRLRIFVEMCRAFDIIPILMTQPLAVTVKNAMTPDWAEPLVQEEFNEVIRSVGLETNTKVIDLASYVAHKVDGNVDLQEYFYDGVHVTDEGSLLYAELIHQQLAPIIRDAISRGGEE